MAFKTVQALDADNVIALGGENRKTGKKNPTQVEGYYLGSRTVESRKSKEGKAKIHFLQTSKGNLGVWGKTDLDRKLSSVEVGSMVRATFSGMKPTPNGDMYCYKIEHDPDNVIEVSLATAEGSDESEENLHTGSDFETVDEETSDEDTTEEDTQSLQLQQQAALARKAKVQALLTKNKKV